MAKKTFKKPEYILDTISGQLDIAQVYGFTPIKTPEYVTVKGKKHTEEMEKTLSFLKFYLENEFYKKEQTFYFAYELPFKKSGKRKSSKNIELELQAIGSLKSISEAICIKTAVAILENEGYKNLIVDINSVGDRDSFTKLEKDLVAYYRKHINTLPGKLRQQFKKNIWNILSCNDKKAEEFCAGAPLPMNVLNDSSRKHFKKVLEFLEVLDIPYSLNPSLIGEKGLNVHTIFEIKSQKKGKKPVVLARGERYNHISRELNMRRDTAGLKIELSFPKKKKLKTINIKKRKNPQFFFVQLGFEAKLRSLNVIDRLYKNKIPVGHALSIDKITEQMNKAERMKVSHMLIMGQREALEHNIVVRDTKNRSQISIDQSNLIKHLKKLSK